MKIIDAHCHIGDGVVKVQTADALLKNMDVNHVNMSVITPVEEYTAVYNEEGNAYILSQVNAHKERFIGFAVANPWYGKNGLQLLERYLGEGLKGIKFNPVIQGFKINDEIIYPFIEIAAKYSIPVYFHTGTPVCAMPFQLYYLAKRYPEVNFIMGHTGYADFWQDIPYIAQHSDNIWFDTSLSLTSRTEAIIEACGYDKIVFASDSPHSNLEYEIKKVVQTGAESKGLETMMYSNIAGLLGVEK